MNIRPPHNEPHQQPSQPPERERAVVPSTRRLSQPLRDTGIQIQNRRELHRRRAAKARRRALVIVTICAAVLAFGFGWRQLSGTRGFGLPSAQRSSARAMDMIRAQPSEPPTPVFASRGSIVMRLPVAVSDLTEVGFHQASYDYALPIKTPLPDADMKTAKRDKGSERDITAQDTAPDAVLTGSVLRMWRDRPGKPNTAADVGAAPGSTVLAPLDGTVVLVKSYKLYGKYSDVQIHIRPDGEPDIDCVMIHIKDPLVKAGDRVTAGVSRIGEIRKLSDRMNMQLGHYTPDGGDHVHLQLNDATHPDYEGLKGAVTASGS